MKLPLGTNALLWWLSDDARLGQQARAEIEDPGNAVSKDRVRDRPHEG